MITMVEKGGSAVYPLLLCSLVARTFIIERTIFWVRQGTGPSTARSPSTQPLVHHRGRVDTVRQAE